MSTEMPVVVVVVLLLRSDYGQQSHIEGSGTDGQYLPSDLLCPETYTWVPIEKCVPRLETSAYSRLHEDARAGDVRALKDLGRVLMLHKRTVMPYAAYSRKRKGCNDEKEVEQYARLLGQTCAERILLYRS
ncbi:arginyl-tRNA--protein transferase 1 isoform X8 [Tachysurus ichikawai]